MLIRDSFVIEKHALLRVIMGQHVASLVPIVVIVVTFASFVLANLVEL